MLEALQIYSMAACRQGVYHNAVAARYVVQRVQALLQISAPITERVNSIERLGGQFWNMQQLFQKRSS